MDTLLCVCRIATLHAIPELAMKAGAAFADAIHADTQLVLREVFPPTLRQVFHQVVEARQGECGVARARGGAATLRSLANAARMLENNPALLRLKTLQNRG